jgi:hypothetical protein
MARTATLAINIISDASGASRGLDEASSKVERFKNGLDKASIAAAGALAGLAALGKQAFDAASDLQQTSGSIEAVFGSYSDVIAKSAQGAATAVGLSKSQYQQMAAIIGSQMKNAGMSMSQATATTQGLIKQGADMAAVFGGTAADAVEALSSALKGEMDPIERYGVSLNQATLEAQMAADGTAGLDGAAGRAAKTQAILEQVTKQTAETTGQWAAQLGTAAEQQQVASASWENAKATLGEQLLPVVTSIVQKLSEFADWAGRNEGLVTAFALAIGGLAAAVVLTNAAFTVYTTITRLAAAAQWLFNIALDANPIGLIIIAVAGLVAMIVLLINHFGGVQGALDAVGRTFSDVFAWIIKVVQPVIDAVKWLLGKLASIGSSVIGMFTAPAAPPAGRRSVLNTGGLFGAPGGAGRLLTAGPSGGGLSPAAAGGSPAATQVINVTVNGALDPNSVAAQIDALLSRRDRNLGRRSPISLGLGGNS